MAFLTPLTKARGMGAAGSGVSHWWGQRITALLMIPLGIWFVCAVIGQMPMEYYNTVHWFSSPFVTLGMILMIAAVFYHAVLGLQVVIEDYIHCPLLQLSLIILVKLAFLAMGVLSVLSIIVLHMSSYTA